MVSWRHAVFAVVSVSLGVQGQDLPRVHEPHETGKYQYWYGNPHAHTTRSDGGGDASAGDCSASTTRMDKAYPSDAFAVASTSGEMDWLMVSEHNHLLDDALPYDTLAPTSSPSAIYAQGRDMADAATTATFVAMYGMEWGTTTGCGHVLLYDAPLLMGWEAGDYDVLTPICQYTGVNGLYDMAARSGNVSPATGLPHLALCHPSDNDMFDTYARDAFSDAAVQGIAVVSGSATSCAEDFPSGGTTSTGTYKNRMIKLLDAGWKVAPEAHQDNHGDNYGSHSQIRTVILAESLTRECLMHAQHHRRVYATQDRNGQLIFTGTANSNCVTHSMGAEMGGQGGVTLHASWWDPDNDELTHYRILRGLVGSGTTSFSGLTIVASGTIGVPAGAITVDAAENIGTGLYYYLVEIRHTGKGDTDVRHTVSSPIWVDYGIEDAGLRPPACDSLIPPPEVSPNGAVVPFSMTKIGAGVEFRFQWIGTGYKYHLYSATTEAEVVSGNYAQKLCDLQANPAGTFLSDGASWITWTGTDLGALPAGNYLVIAEETGQEGAFGFDSGDNPRPNDADAAAPIETGCPTCP